MRSFFARLDEKHKLLGNFEIFNENSLEKLDFVFLFFIFFRKFVTKNRAFGNNTIFLQQFFRFRGGEFPPFPPGYALGLYKSLLRDYVSLGPFVLILIDS